MKLSDFLRYFWYRKEVTISHNIVSLEKQYFFEWYFRRLKKKEKEETKKVLSCVKSLLELQPEQMAENIQFSRHKAKSMYEF